MTVILQCVLYDELPGTDGKVLNDAFGIARGYMVTIHSYTGRSADGRYPAQGSASRPGGGGIDDPDQYRGRALRRAGNTAAQGQAGRDRDPSADTQRIVWCRSIWSGEQPTAPQINDAMKAAATGQLRGILTTTLEKLVSVDFNHLPLRCIFDATQTRPSWMRRLAHCRRLVRQRMGLCLPDVGHRRTARQPLTDRLSQCPSIRLMTLSLEASACCFGPISTCPSRMAR